MLKKSICEVMYTSHNENIEPRRKGIAIPLLITVTGVVLLAINCWVLAGCDMPNIKSAIVLFGATGVMVGGAMLTSRLSGKSLVPYHTKDRCFLKKEVLKFSKDQKQTILELVNNGDFTTLRTTPTAEFSSIVVEIYSSPIGTFVAAQVFENIDLELCPISEVKIVI